MRKMNETLAGTGKIASLYVKPHHTTSLLLLLLFFLKLVMLVPYV